MSELSRIGIAVNDDVAQEAGKSSDVAMFGTITLVCDPHGRMLTEKASVMQKLGRLTVTTSGARLP